MNRRALLIWLILGVMAATSGCCQLSSVLCSPFGQCIAICDPTHCGDAACGAVCGEPCGPACAPGCGSACEPCGDVCACGGPCGDPYCDCCGDGGCGSFCDPCGHPWGPLSWLFGIFTCGYCGSGCGEFYWSDFHSEPPDCCDPCDRCGNWTGGYYGGGCSVGEYCQSPQPQTGYAARKQPQTGYIARKQPQKTGHLASTPSPSVRRVSDSWAKRNPEGYVITDPSSPYAPRLVSVTEHVVGPTLAESAPAEQTTVRQTAVRQTSVKQAARLQPTPAP